jgi:hypothetical protein
MLDVDASFEDWMLIQVQAGTKKDHFSYEQSEISFSLVNPL